MKINNLLLAAILLSLVASSCVSSQKYNDMVTARDHYRAQYESMKTLESENEECQRQLRVAENKLQRVNEILATEKMELEKVKEARELLASQYDKVASENAKILSEYSSDKATMEERLSSATDELYLRDRQLQNLENTVGVQTYDLQTREERLAELERLLAEKDAQMAKMRMSLSSGLRGYEDADLSVRERDGKIYVTMSQKLLFGKGSATVDANGKAALEKLAKALSDNPNIDVIVEGHTDNTGAVEYNLNLSIERAMEVAKILAYEGVLPNRITPTGKGMHHPIVPNTTEENRAMNRRVEIVLSPNLDKLYETSK